MNGSQVKGARYRYWFSIGLVHIYGLTISYLCTRAQDDGGYFDLEEAMVDFIKDCELGLESPSFQSLPAEFIQQAGNTCCASVITEITGDCTIP